MLIVVTEKIVHYKSKVWAIIVFTKLEGSLWSVALGKSFWKFPKSFVVVAFQSKKGLRKNLSSMTSPVVKAKITTGDINKLSVGDIHCKFCEL